MTALQWVFIGAAAVTLLAAIGVVTARRMMHAALLLALALLGIAVLFITLESNFFAIIQVLVYIGAILTLIIFAVMLTRRSLEDVGPQLNSYFRLAAILAVLLWAGLGFILGTWVQSGVPLSDLGVAAESIVLLGQSLVDIEGFAVPFEVASVLLLAALIGAIYIAFERKEDRA
jgi:NADH-quinone oxidoreductase subunit J